MVMMGQKGEQSGSLVSGKAELCSCFRQSECNFAKSGKRSSPLYVLTVKVQASLIATRAISPIFNPMGALHASDDAHSLSSARVGEQYEVGFAADFLMNALKPFELLLPNFLNQVLSNLAWDLSHRYCTD